MAMVSRDQVLMGPDAVAQHPDFQDPWVRKILSDPGLKWTQQVPRQFMGDTVTNNMFEKTLNGEQRLKAHLSFNRPSREADAMGGMEECFLMSVGHDIDGAVNRAHGGFNALVLDQIQGSCSHHHRPDPIPPATATLTVDYLAPVNTSPAPCIILCRGWVTKIDGRKIWTKAVLEDRKGVECARSHGLFIRAKGAHL